MRGAAFGAVMGIAIGVAGHGVSDWRFWLLMIVSSFAHTLLKDSKPWPDRRKEGE